MLPWGGYCDDCYHGVATMILLHVVVTMMLLSCCCYHVVVTMGLLPWCCYHVVVTMLLLPCCSYHGVAGYHGVVINMLYHDVITRAIEPTLISTWPLSSYTASQSCYTGSFFSTQNACNVERHRLCSSTLQRSQCTVQAASAVLFYIAQELSHASRVRYALSTRQAADTLLNCLSCTFFKQLTQLGLPMLCTSPLQTNQKLTHAWSVVQLYTAEELTAIEAAADCVNSKAHAGLLPPECFHVTAGKSGSPKRTKFFFGARYLWTREQMSSTASARRANGVRVDVPAVPSWIQVIRASVHPSITNIVAS